MARVGRGRVSIQCWSRAQMGQRQLIYELPAGCPTTLCPRVNKVLRNNMSLSLRLSDNVSPAHVSRVFLQVLTDPTYMEDHLGVLDEEVAAGEVPLPQLPMHKQVRAGTHTRLLTCGAPGVLPEGGVTARCVLLAATPCGSRAPGACAGISRVPSFLIGAACCMCLPTVLVLLARAVV